MNQGPEAGKRTLSYVKRAGFLAAVACCVTVAFIIYYYYSYQRHTRGRPLVIPQSALTSWDTAHAHTGDAYGHARETLRSDTWMSGALLRKPFSRYEHFYRHVSKYVRENGSFPFHLMSKDSLYRSISGIKRLSREAKAGDLYNPLPGIKNPCWVGESGVLCLPYFLQIGFPKCGTTTLFYKLSAHPQIVPPLVKEPTVWGSHNDSDLDDYVGSVFKRMGKLVEKALRGGDKDVLDNLITGEGYPGSAWRLDKWREPKLDQLEPKYINALTIKSLLPNLKMLVIVRNPISRTLSHYQYFRANKKSQSPDYFHEVVVKATTKAKAIIERDGMRSFVYKHGKFSEFGLLIPSMYYIFLRDWFSLYDRDRFHIIRGDDYYQKPNQVLQNITTFLGIAPYPESHLTLLNAEGQTNLQVLEAAAELSDDEEIYRADIRKQTKNIKTKIKMVGEMSDSTREVLRDFFKPFNILLADLLQDASYLDWNS